MNDRVADLVRRVEQSRLPSPKTRRLVRERAGLSMSEIARALGVHPQTIIRWEEGAAPRMDQAVAYRELLDALAGVVGMTEEMGE